MNYPCDSQTLNFQIDDDVETYITEKLLDAKSDRTVLNVVIDGSYEKPSWYTWSAVYCYTENSKSTKYTGNDAPLAQAILNIPSSNRDMVYPCNEDITLYGNTEDTLGFHFTGQVVYVDRLLTTPPQCSELQASSTPQVSQGFTYGEIFTGCFLFVFSLALITGFIIKKVYQNDNK